MLVWCSVQLVLIKFNKVVHGILNSVHWSQITELASDLDSVDLRAPVINYLKGSSQTKDTKFGKRLPSWEGPYKVVEIVPKNLYFIQSLLGRNFQKLLVKIFHEAVGLIIP
jgi:hypothetical protein